MSQPSLVDNWERGDAYERYVGRWSRQVAPLFLDWLDAPAGLGWLDIGCGTGALSAAILSHHSPRRVTGLEPSAGFLKTAGRNLAGRATLVRGTATAIPLAAESMDVVVSGLVLNFVPNPRAALREMARVIRPGGTLGIYLWDYADKMEFMRLFWDCAVSLDPAALPLDEGRRFPMCSPAGLNELFAGAGLAKPDLTAIDIPTRFAGFDDFWQPFLDGQGPAPSYLMALDPEARERLRECLVRIIPVQPDGSIDLLARVWAVAWRKNRHHTMP